MTIPYTAHAAVPTGSRSPRCRRLTAGLLLSLATALCGAPVLVCEPVTVSVGAVGPADRPAAEFELRNTGDEPLVISRTRAGCAGCMTVEYPEKPIPPGGTASLKVTLTDLRTPGPVRKLVYVHSNDPVRPEVLLTVTADVRGTWSLSPSRSLALGEVQAGTVHRQDFVLTLGDGIAAAITAVEAPAGFSVTLALNDRAERHALHVATVPEKLPVGMMAGTVTVRTDAPGLPQIMLPLRVSVIGPVMPHPARIVLGMPQPDGTAPALPVFPPSRAKLILTASAGKVPALDRIEAPAGVLVRAEAGAAAAAALEVSLAADARPGPPGAILIHFAEKGVPPVSVPLSVLPAKALNTAGATETRAASGPLAFEVLVERLGRHLGCSDSAILAGGSQDERTQMAVWLAERLCDPSPAGRQARLEALGAMSPIRYARAGDMVAARMRREAAYRNLCEKALAAVRDEAPGAPGR